ncbi:MAG: hypothetical protein WAM11_17210 [Cyanobium sp.]
MRCGVDLTVDCKLAIELRQVAPLPDLPAAQSVHLDARATLRLLRWWVEDPQQHPAPASAS